MTRKYSKEIPGKKKKQQGSEALVEVEHLPLSVWTTRKSDPGSVMVICRQLRETGVIRRQLWINTWCLSQMGWMLLPQSWKELLQKNFDFQQHQ